jgi:hypothetical protein
MCQSWRHSLTPCAARKADLVRRRVKVYMSRKWTLVLALAAIGVLLGTLILPIPVDEWRTLASLRKVDDHPLYVMKYYGGYGFEELLQQDTSSARASVVVTAGPGQAWACTCFAALGEGIDVLLGRNFDWYNHPALLLFADPPEGYASVSMVDISYLGFGQDVPSWQARQPLLLAPHLPFDGMNECGLGVGMMAVPAADSGHDPKRTTLDSLQVIRLLLDHAAGVDEAVALLRGCNVDFGGGPPVHYLLADSDGRSAVVEFVDGEMKVLRHRGPWQVATNFVIAETMPEGSNSSCWRYDKAYDTLAEAEGELSGEQAMVLLKSVSQQTTIWSLVYNLASGAVDVVMGRHYEKVHRFRL